MKIAGTTQIFREGDDLQCVDYSYNKILRNQKFSFEDSRDVDLQSNTEKDEVEEMIKVGTRNSFCKFNYTENVSEPVVHLLYKDGQYWIYNKPFYNKSDDFIGNPENLVWYSVRDYRNSASSLGYKLKRGDILKFGRARVRVVEINLGDCSSNSDCRIKQDTPAPPAELPSDLIVSEENYSDTPTCRICFAESEDDNPLISPCLCSGSLKFIHYQCLKSWLESKRTVKNTETTISYHWKSLECELCKTIYPELVKTKYSLATYDKPEKDYMILESISTASSKSIYVVDLDSKNDVFRIGRGHDSDIRVSDISVSRFHALIVKTSNNELVVKDNNSKFGTLICLQHPLLLSEYDSIHLQAGRTLLEIQMKEKKDWTLRGCLWVRQDNEGEELVRTDNYLGKFGYTDSFLPEEFKLFWDKGKTSGIKLHKSSSMACPSGSFSKRMLGTEVDFEK